MHWPDMFKTYSWGTASFDRKHRRSGVSSSFPGAGQGAALHDKIGAGVSPSAPLCCPQPATREHTAMSTASDHGDLPAAQQTRNVLLYATNVALVYLASPVLYIS